MVAVVTGVAACGGGPKDSPPTPLARHYDDMYLADIGLEAKTNIVTSQNEWAKAKMENAKAESDFNAITTQLSIVRNDQKAAKLKVDSAIANKKSAEASADTNRMNQAQKELRTAELAVKAADARIKYYEAVRDYYKRQWRYAQENMYWREAQYELAKSDLGQKNNKAPKGIEYPWFPKQEAERQKRTANARDKAETEKGRAAQAREKWIKEQQASDTAAGAPANLPDPMAPSPAPTASTTPT
ncbi:MAG: hypothetical protein KF773_21805 [Deltaproteobacteria bacterium]|nr:hypothetical protein [Deltaproteobacteria bacterium]MCW5802058.1 hypothetical protein [Deltaproteobacteria bacterium]